MTKEFIKQSSSEEFTVFIDQHAGKQKSRVLIDTISVQEEFGLDAKAFYEEESIYGDLYIEVDIDISAIKGTILSIEKKYQSDGKSIDSRSVRWEDVIEVYVTYEEDIHIEGFNKNFYKLDMNPMRGHFYTAASEKGFKYIPVEEEFASAEDISERETIELNTHPIYLYLVPQKIKDPKTGEVIQNTSRDRTIYHTDQSAYFNPNHPDYNHGLFLLAEMMNQNPMHLKEDSVYLDTRTRGGGIKTEVSRKEIERTDKTSLHNWDIGYFDGQAYQENGVFVVQVDANRFKEMTDEEIVVEKKNIEKAVEKYKAFGVLPFIEFNQETEIELGELIPNGEFEKGLPCGYFSEGRSSGDWSIIYKELGAGDNYVVRLVDDATFAIRIPGFNFNAEERYLFEVKGMKDPNVITITRSAGRIVCKYEDGSEDVHRMGEFTQSYWLSIQKDFRIDPEKKLKEVFIEINDDGQRNGTMYYDYVSLVSLGNITDSQEIVEL